MSNILFYSRFAPDPSPNSGGIEKVTSVLSKNIIRDKRHMIYYMTPESWQQDQADNSFSGILYLDRHVWMNYNKLLDFIQKNKIDLIVSQYANDKYNKLFVRIKEKLGLKLIVAYHFSPGCEMQGIRSFLKHSLDVSFKGRIKRMVKLVLKPLYLSYKEKSICSNVNYAFRNSDCFLLLSDRFKDSFIDNYKIKSGKEKIHAIGNPLSFDKYFPKDQISYKEKIVLVVARHCETEKRISLVFKIWNNIEQSGFSDWKLVLVGSGEDSQNYKSYVQKLGLKNVEFVDKTNPYPYYNKASIFLMTSMAEGFGVTLTEAQQMGVVPVAFDSYASLHDIIKHGYNGIIVENNNIQSFTEELAKLMNDDTRREKLATSAIESCKKFSVESIKGQWLQLFDDVINKKI